MAYKPYDEWELVTDKTFLFSLYNNSLVELTRATGAGMFGYFKGLHRITAAVSVASPLSTKTLLSFRKFTVDRLGRRREVTGEVRTWRGAACT